MNTVEIIKFSLGNNNYSMPIDHSKLADGLLLLHSDGALLQVSMTEKKTYQAFSRLPAGADPHHFLSHSWDNTRYYLPHKDTHPPEKLPEGSFREEIQFAGSIDSEGLFKLPGGKVLGFSFSKDAATEIWTDTPTSHKVKLIHVQTLLASRSPHPRGKAAQEAHSFSLSYNDLYLHLSPNTVAFHSQSQTPFFIRIPSGRIIKVTGWNTKNNTPLESEFIHPTPLCDVVAA